MRPVGQHGADQLDDIAVRVLEIEVAVVVLLVRQRALEDLDALGPKELRGGVHLRGSSETKGEVVEAGAAPIVVRGTERNLVEGDIVKSATQAGHAFLV